MEKVNIMSSFKGRGLPKNQGLDAKFGDRELQFQ